MLTLLYLLLCFWLLPRLSFFRNAELGTVGIRLALLFKLAVGLLAAAYFARLPLADVVMLNNESTLHYQRLLHQPGLFLADIKGYFELYGPGHFFAASDSAWGYTRFIFFFKLMAVIDLITGTNIYLNTLVFSTLVFPAHIAFYRIATGLYKHSKIWPRLLVAFGIPSLMLFTACPHKDGLVFLALAICSFVYFRWLHGHPLRKWLNILAFCGGILLILVIRNFVLVAMLPAMLAGLLAQYCRERRWMVVAGFYILSVLVFFGSSFLPGSLNLPAAVLQRRAAFASLPTGNTQLQMDSLPPTPGGFAQILPQAMGHAFLAPYPNKAAAAPLLLASLEPYIYLLLLLVSIVMRRKEMGMDNYTIYALTFFITMMFIIGYTIPNAGAIIRYRSLFWVFLLTPVVCNINWKRRRVND